MTVDILAGKELIQQIQPNGEKTLWLPRANTGGTGLPMGTPEQISIDSQATFPDFRSKIGEQLAQLAMVLGQAVETLSKVAKDFRNGQTEEGEPTRFLQTGKINGTLRLNGDERIWSYLPEPPEGGN